MRIYALPPLALRESPGDKTLNQQDCALTLRFWMRLSASIIVANKIKTIHLCHNFSLMKALTNYNYS
jgi:hypothetical protein